MSEPFIGEICMFAGNFAPRNWAFCNGQLINVSQNTALFSLFGTTYGGDGRTTFGLPDLQGRAAMHPGNGPGLTSRRLGESGGVAEVTLNTSQVPPHTHSVNATSEIADDFFPAGNIPANSGAENRYHVGTDTDDLAELQSVGGNEAHENRQPYQSVNFIVALIGLYPTRS